MPLEQRVVSPVLVSRGCVPTVRGQPVAVANELECVTNGTLANIIRQLAALAQHADDLFSGLLTDASKQLARAHQLAARVDRLAQRVQQLDAPDERADERLLQLHLKKAFRSAVATDQQVVHRQSMPESLQRVYRTCDAPPPLNKLNPFREDGRDGLSFYTDPEYFFVLWRSEMLKDPRRQSKDRHKRRPNKQANGPLNNHQVDARRARPSQPPPAPPQQHLNSLRAAPAVDNQQMHAPVSVSLPPPPEEPEPEVPPPPPPPPTPPPPPNCAPQQQHVAHQQHHNNQQQPPQHQQVQQQRAPAVGVSLPDRSDLLAAIREGIKLKRVEASRQRDVDKQSPLHDVASILARRVAIELSDDDESEDDDDQQWDDESEC